MRLALALLLAVACAEPGPRPSLTIYGERLTNATWDRVSKALPHMPAEPWPCVWTIELGDACPGTHGCYWPDEYRILTTQAALAHELAHAAGECAGDYDPQHRAAWWREVDR